MTSHTIMIVPWGAAIVLAVLLIAAIGLSIGAFQTGKPILKILFFGGAACFWAVIASVAVQILSIGLPDSIKLDR